MQSIGKYKVIAEIGTGSTGTIYQGRDQVLDRAVALKVLRTDADLDPELKERFYREARACARLAHPNIITVYDLGEADGAVYIAMELLSGSDLRKLLQEKRKISLAAKLDIMAQVCDALEHAHAQQLVHRDIKPSNIFLCDDQRAKILDFGIARLPTSNLTMAGKVLGSPNYMAPEQIRGGKCDSRSDLFSAAIVAFEFIAGSHPFQDDFIPRRIVGSPPDSLRQHVPGAPEALESLLLRAMEKDPEKRIQKAGEFAAGFRAVLEIVRSSPPEPITVAAPAAPSNRPQTAQRAALRPGETTGEHRVSEFLQAVGEFDEGLEKNNTEAAQAAVERMRRLAARDNRFALAVTDCESRLNQLTAPAPASAPQAVVTNGPSPDTKPVNLSSLPTPRRQETVAVPEPPQPGAGKNRTLLVAVAAVVILGALLFWIKQREPSKPPGPPGSVAMVPAVATANVGGAGADLLSTPNSSGQHLTVLERGQSVNVIAIPTPGNSEFTNVQVVVSGTPLPAGFVRTADLANWTGNSAEAAFSILRLLAPAETAAEPELKAQLEKWNEFFTRFPASPDVAAGRLEAARLNLALARIGKGAGKPAAEWRPYVDRAKEELSRVTGSPELEKQAAALRLQLADAPPATNPNAPPPEGVWRARVNALWEEGKYQQAMDLIDQILAASPGHPEALVWKKKIRASQLAEARAQ
jgi:serine/threonine protein kinase